MYVSDSYDNRSKLREFVESTNTYQTGQKIKGKVDEYKEQHKEACNNCKICSRFPERAYIGPLKDCSYCKYVVGC